MFTPASSALAMVIGGVALTLAGLALAFWSLLWDCWRNRARRRRRCPRCWYELAPSAGLRCSECGVEARSERSLHASRRRWGWAAIALLMTLAGGALLFMQSHRRFDWNTIKPTWLLMIEAERDDRHPQTGSRARLELRKRVIIGRLNGSARDNVIAHAMSIQADPNGPFGSMDMAGFEWCAIIHAAMEKGLLSPAQRDAYLRNMFSPGFFVEMRPIIRAGEFVPVRVGGKRTRSGMTTIAPRAMLECAAQRVDAPDLWDGRAWTHRIFSVGNSSTAGSWTEYLFRPGLPAGQHTITWDFALAIFDDQSRDMPVGRSNRPIEADPRALLRWRESRSIDVTVVPAGEPIVRMVRDDAMRSRIMQAITMHFTGEDYRQGSRRIDGSRGVINVITLPVHLSLHAYARVGDREEFIGAITVLAGAPAHESTQITARHPREFFPDARQFDLILRPSPTPAERTIEILEAWDGDEIVFENVPLRP